MKHLGLFVKDTLLKTVPSGILNLAVYNDEQWHVVCRRTCIASESDAAKAARDMIRVKIEKGEV